MVYRDFFKQIQYKMDILERCEDANVLAVSGAPVTFPTNTYYPPGYHNHTKSMFSECDNDFISPI